MGSKRSSARWGDIKKHPGVYLTVRKDSNGSATAHRARWIDPDTQKWEYATLEAQKPPITRKGEALDWLVAKSNEIRRRYEDLGRGAARRVDLSVSDAVENYLERKRAKWRPRTTEVYERDLTEFSDWCEENGIESISDLGRAHLNALKDHLETRPKARSKDGSPRSKASVNSNLASLRVFLNDAARMEWLQIDSAIVADVLRAVRTERNLPRFLRQSEVRKLLRASVRHDAATFVETRAEHRGKGEKGKTKCFTPVAPLLAAALLSGCRIGELEGLSWEEVDLEREEISLAASRTKTKHGRMIDLRVCPTLVELLRRMRLGSGGDAFVFGGEEPLTHTLAESNRKRLVRAFSAPRFSWHDLRRTCATFLTNSPGIYGGASAFHSAKRTGHSVAVAERSYAGLLRDIAADANTLEAAMDAEEEFGAIVDTLAVGAKDVAVPAG